MYNYSFHHIRADVSEMDLRVLLVVEDQLTRRRLEFLLKRDGCAVTAATDAVQALEIMKAENAPRLVILDLLLSGMNSLEFCRRVRQVPFAIPPYIILLSVKGEDDELGEGLEAGADDFVSKPFGPSELRARVRVGEQMWRLRRRLAERGDELKALAGERRRQSPLTKDRHVYEFGPFRLDAGERRLLRGDRALALAAKVFDLLLLLVRNGDRLVGKNEIMGELWPDKEVEENNLTVSMSALRKALGGEPGEYIQTVSKQGYRFVAEVRRRIPSTEGRESST